MTHYTSHVSLVLDIDEGNVSVSGPLLKKAIFDSQWINNASVILLYTEDAESGQEEVLFMSEIRFDADNVTSVKIESTVSFQIRTKSAHYIILYMNENTSVMPVQLLPPGIYHFRIVRDSEGSGSPGL